MWKYIMSWRRRLNNFKYYRDILEKHRDVLEMDYSVRIDNIWRLYTVFSVDPADYFTYGGRKKAHEYADGGALMNGDDFFEKKVKTEITRIDSYLREIGLAELYGLSDKKRIDSWNYKIIIRFKEIDTLFWANIVRYGSFAILMGLSIGLVIVLF